MRTIAILTTSYQKLAEQHLGTDSYNHNLYIRLYARYTQQDVANNRTYVQYQARTYFDGTYILDQQGTYNLSGTGATSSSGSCTRPTNGEITIATIEGWVTHESDGTKTISGSATLNFPNWGWGKTANAIVTLPTIPRASSVSGGNGNIGETTTINISRASNSFTHTLTYVFGNLSGTIATGVGISCEWIIPTSFYSQIPNSNIGVGTINCITYSENTEIGRKSISFEVKVINSNPSIFDFMYADIGGMTPNGNVTVNLTGNENVIIKGYSSLYLKITNEAVAKNSASISYYQIDNVKVNVGDISPIQFQIDNYNKDTITIMVVDSRGNSTSVTKKIQNLLNYNDLIKGNIKLSRSDGGVGKFVTLDFNGIFWNDSFGKVDNELNVIYKYKKTNDTNYVNGTTNILTTINEENFNFNGLIEGDTEDKGFDINSSYDLIVEVSDKINTIKFVSVIGAGTPAIAIYQNFVSLGKKYDVSLGGIQLWGDIYINGSNFFKYSTEEHIVGFWIDGKPIYRKVLTGNMTNTTNTWVDLINLSSLEIDEVVRIDGTIKNTSTDLRVLSANSYENSSYSCLFSYLGNTKKLQVYVNGWTSNTYGFVYRVILEYTKTTD